MTAANKFSALHGYATAGKLEVVKYRGRDLYDLACIATNEKYAQEVRRRIPERSEKATKPCSALSGATTVPASRTPSTPPEALTAVKRLAATDGATTPSPRTGRAFLLPDPHWTPNAPQRALGVHGPRVMVPLRKGCGCRGEVLREHSRIDQVRWPRTQRSR